jgi:quinol-cytochrome oxidoreductase complex cytochrome b subunit
MHGIHIYAFHSQGIFQPSGSELKKAKLVQLLCYFCKDILLSSVESEIKIKW